MIVHSLYWCFMASEMKHVHHNTLIKKHMTEDIRRKIVFSLSVNMGCVLCTSNNSLCLSLADSNFEAEFLQTHNAYRKQHGAPSLTINKNLCRSSQEWAEHLLVNQDPQTQQQGLRGKSVLCLEFSYQKTHRLAFCSKNQSMKSNSSKRQIKDKCYQSGAGLVIGHTWHFPGGPTHWRGRQIFFFCQGPSHRDNEQSVAHWFAPFTQRFRKIHG